MKRNRLLTDAFREIRKTKGRFLSLFLLSALAVAFLAGLRTTAPDMERTADRYFDNQRLMDLRVLSTLGLTNDDIEVLAGQPGISAAEGAYTVDALVHTEQNDLILKLHSLSPTGINAPELLEGRLPENGGECVVEQKVLTTSGLSIGDAISFDTGYDVFENSLRRASYTIVGTVNSPLYVSIERGSSSLGSGKVSAFALLPEEAFDMDAYTDGYLLLDGAEQLLCYSDGYDVLMDRLKSQLKPLSDARAALRHDDVVGEANETLSDAQKEFDDAEAEANRELSDGSQELQDARIKLDDGWAEYEDGKATLKRETTDAQQKIADAESKLPDARQSLDDAKQELDSGEAEYADGVGTLTDGKSDYAEGYQTWLDGKRDYDENLVKLTDGQKEYDDGLKEYQKGVVALQNGAGQLAAAKKQLDSASAQLAAGSASLAAGQKQYEEGKAQFDGQVAQMTQALAAMGITMTGDALLDLLATPPTDPADPMYPIWAGILQAIPGGADTAALLVATRDQLTSAKAQLDSGSASLSSGYTQYSQGKREYKEAKAAFDESVVKLQDAYQELTDAKAELDDGWTRLADGKQELDDGQKELEDNALTIAAAETELMDARKKLDDGWTEYNDGEAEYAGGVAELQDAKRKLPAETAKAQRELSDALLALQDGETEYADGLVAYEDGKAEADEKLSDARKELNDARREISEIEACEWYVLGRNTNMGYVSYQQDAERMGNLASVFPLIFFLVAALVCLTTMTRMVEEQRVQIGGMKALGYSKGAIALKYVGYGFLSSFLGGAVGLAAGCIAIPMVIFTAWGALYTIGGLIIPFYPGISLLSVGAAVLCVTGTAFAACFAALHAVPAELMRPRAPKPGKRVILERIKNLWIHMSFTWKVTARNLFRYQRRFWMTVIGIGGCTALIIAGFGIRDSILDTLNNQYDDISTYSADISLADGLTADEYLEISRVMDGASNVAAWMPCSATVLTAESAKRTMDVSLFAVEDRETFRDFIHLRHRPDGERVTLPVDGAVITEKLAEMLGVAVGDTITLDGDDRVQVRVADITENYILHYVYLSAAYYETLYGETPETNVLLARYADESKAASDALSTQLIGLSGVNSVSLIRETRDTFSKSLETVNYAVVVVIVAAAALAFVVLFNLTNINITERMRELATLKVLGFYDGELSSYVYRENVFLTIFGMLLGLVMGKFLHQWLVLTVEIDMVMFGRTARPESYLYAMALTLLFSFLVNLAARKKLKRIDMVESLKTVD